MAAENGPKLPKKPQFRREAAWKVWLIRARDDRDDVTLGLRTLGVGRPRRSDSVICNGRGSSMNEKLKSLAFNLLLVVIFVALGPGMLVGGLYQLVAGPGNEVKCSGEVMHEGDVCRETRNGSPVGAKSYSEQRDEQNSFMSRVGWPVIEVIFGSLVTLGVGFLFVRSARSKRRRGPSAPAGP